MSPSTKHNIEHACEKHLRACQTFEFRRGSWRVHRFVWSLWKGKPSSSTTRTLRFEKQTDLNLVRRAARKTPGAKQVWEERAAFAAGLRKPWFVTRLELSARVTKPQHASHLQLPVTQHMRAKVWQVRAECIPIQNASETACDVQLEQCGVLAGRLYDAPPEGAQSCLRVSDCVSPLRCSTRFGMRWATCTWSGKPR